MSQLLYYTIKWEALVVNRYTGIYRRCELLYIRSELDKYRIQPLEGKMLFFLSKNCCTQEEIGQHFNIDKGRIARALSELEERELVCRKVNQQNKRQKLVSLTTEGEQIVSEIDAIFRRWDEICYDGFSEEERRLYQDFVKRIADNVIEYRHRQGEDDDGQ
ncbi:MarR family winged helix-turn-helix transcriptional regulator [Clostridium porci]|uniref:MarR family winged helix-turn-helix transcriptional regulator n=1 Tax=Clostridium porci TaxID=2605778 RepID=UPI003A8D9B2E